MLTLTIPLTIFSVFFISSFHSIYNEKHQASIQREVTDLSLNMNSQLRALSNYLSLLCQDTFIRGYVDSWTGSEEDIANLRKAINHNNFASPHLIDTDIIVLSPDGSVIFGSKAISNLCSDDVFFAFAQQAYSPAHRGMIWFTDNQLIGQTGSEVEYCFIAAPIRESSFGTSHGYIALRMRQSSLVSMYLVATDEQTNFFVLDANGSIIASVDTMGVTDLISDIHNRTIMQAPEKIDGGDYILYPIKLSNSWVLVSITQAHATTPEMTMKTNTFLLALFFTVFITLAVAYVMSRRFVKPIANMIVQMDNVADGDLSSHVAVNSNDELSQLADHYNRMIDRLQELVTQIVIEQEEKRRAAIIAYQTQINPHFLMNTLSSIRYMIYTSDPKDIDKMILALTKILKYALPDSGEYATLSMELEQLRNYMTIQQFGFDSPLDYDITVDPKLEDCKIVKLLLQPLAENAVLHGLKMQQNNPLLTVTAVALYDNRIQITISDNGIGFDSENVMAQLADGTYTGIGLGNVYNRLLLHYGNNFSFDIESHTEGNTGTRIVIIIPRETNKEIEP